VVYTTLFTPIGSLRVPVPPLAIYVTVFFILSWKETAGFVETLVPTRLQGLTSQKALHFIVTTARSSDFTKNNRKNKKEKSKKQDKVK
jgi:hypothetical protein